MKFRQRTIAACHASVEAEMDPFDQAMRALKQWDRDCRELHQQFLRDTSESLAAIKEATNGNQ